jgi:hypothetical protein
LQVQPELGTVAEAPDEPQNSVRSDVALAKHDPVQSGSSDTKRCGEATHALPSGEEIRRSNPAPVDAFRLPLQIMSCWRLPNRLQWRVASELDKQISQAGQKEGAVRPARPDPSTRLSVPAAFSDRPFANRLTKVLELSKVKLPETPIRKIRAGLNSFGKQNFLRPT